MPSISRAEMAENYGLALSFMRSHPELNSIFDKAVKNTWTPDRFMAAVKGSKWYEKTSESRRNAQLQRDSDPATYRASVNQVAARVRIMAAEYGANKLSASALKSLAEDAYTSGWDDNQLRARLSKFVGYTKKDGWDGLAGQVIAEANQYAAQMGVRTSMQARKNWARRIVSGKATMEDFKDRIRRNAISAYPHLAQRIHEGETVADIADPYRQSMAELLEISPDMIGVRNKLIQQGISAKAKDGGRQVLSLSEFEDQVRKDSRWKRTDNAKDAAASTTRGLLESMGLIAGG